MSDIRPLTYADRVCLSCQVPGGCDETHPFCLWRELGGNGQKPLSAKSRRILHRQRAVLRHLQRDEVGTAELADALGWDVEQAYTTIRALRDRGLVERVGWNGTARWRVVEVR